jgi:Zn-dependent protease with chaperone function
MRIIEWIQGEPWLERLGWALLHSTWTTTACAAAYKAVQAVTTAASRRYTAGLALLALAIVLPAGLVIGDLRFEGVGGVSGGARAFVFWGAPDGATGTLGPVAVPAGSRAAAVLPWVAAAWLVAVTALWLRLCCGAFSIRRLASESREPVPEPFAGRVRELAARLGAPARVVVRISSTIDVPCALGLFRPAVLVPLATLTGLPAAHLDALLLHELAHVRRRDYLVNLVQTLAETLLFFHPLSRWLSAQIRREREHCCDDLVVAATSEPEEYARALTALERLRGPSFAQSATGGDLRPRVRRLLGRELEGPATAAVPGAALLLSGLVVLCAIAIGLPEASEASRRAGAPRVAEGKAEATSQSAIVRIDARLFEIEEPLVDQLTVRWDRSRSGHRLASGETETLLRELDSLFGPSVASLRPGTLRISSPSVLTRLGEAATIVVGGAEGGVRLELLPTGRGGTGLELAVKLSTGPGSADGAIETGNRSLILAPVAVEPGRSILVLTPFRVGPVLPWGDPRGGAETRRADSLRLGLTLTAGRVQRASLQLPSSSLDESWGGEPITLSLRSGSLREFVETVTTAFGAEVAWGGEGEEMPERELTLELREVPWEFALVRALHLSCLVAERDGKLWTVRDAPPGPLATPGGGLPVTCPAP